MNSEKLAKPCKIEHLGAPVKNSFILHSVKGNEDGRDVLYFSVVGTPSTFIVYDVNKKEVVRSFAQGCDRTDTLTTACWTHAKDKFGNVYMAPFGYPGQLFKYDVSKKDLITIGSPFSEHALFHVSTDEEGNVFGGTYSSGKVFKYDVKLNEFIDFGTQVEDNMYVQSSVYCDGCVYGGTRSNDPKFFKLDVEKKETTVIDVPLLKDVSLSSFYYITRVGHLVFPVAKTAEGDFIILCYNTKTEQFENVYELGLGGQHISEELDNKVYFVAKDGYIKYIDLSTFKTYNTEIEYLVLPEGDDGFDYANGFMGGGFYKLEDQEKYPGYTYVTVNYDHNSPAYINLQNKTVEFVDNSNLPKNSINIHAMNALPNGNIIFGSYMGVQALIYDPLKNEYSSVYVRQTEGIANLNKTTYFGVYTRAAIWEYESEKPYIREENPKPLFNVGYEQDRPFALVGGDDKLFIGTVPDYGKLGGALTIYDPKTKEKKVFRNIIKNQTITSLCYKDGLIYGSTGIFGGLGSIPSEENAKMFIFDVAKEKVILEKELNFQERIMHIGSLNFDKYGTLWGISSGVVMTLNEKTLEVIDKLDVSGINFNIKDTIWRPRYMVFSDDDVLYANPDGKLTAIDIKTKEVRKYNSNAYVMAMGKDKNLYFGQGADFYKLVINVK